MGKNLNPWDIQEFFRIEALLRSPNVMALYKTIDPAAINSWTEDSLDVAYMIHVSTRWRVLWGGHHWLVGRGAGIVGELTGIVGEGGGGITNLKKEFEFNRANSGTGPKERWLKYFGDALRADNPTFLYLQINAKDPKQKLLMTIAKMIDQQKKEIKKMPVASEWFRSQHKENLKPGDRRYYQWRKTKTVIKFDIQTWIDYFRCYDLRQCKGKTFGQIAGTVYGDSKTKYDAAEKAVKRVRILIWYAETNNWPPPSNYLNKTFPPSPPQ